ncbi:hypothetical protein MCHI_001431, partial [Candidatus Magnetoovum chiemensis]
CREKIVLRTEIETDDFIKIVQIANDVKNQKNNKTGSVIDIDAVKRKPYGENFFNDLNDILNKGHEEEKEFFFNLLKNEFLSKINIEY